MADQKKGPPSVSKLDWMKKVSLWDIMKWAFGIFVIILILNLMGVALGPLGYGLPQPPFRRPGFGQTNVPPTAPQFGGQLPTANFIEVPLNPRGWTEVTLSAQPTTIFLPASAQVDIRPGGNCNGVVDFGNVRLPIYLGMPAINQPMPVQLVVYGQGSIFFQARPN